MKQIIIQEKDFQTARKKIRNAKKDRFKVVFSSTDDDLNRKILEKEDIDVLLISLSERKDYSKQRNSGFNQVLAKTAKKKNISLGINLDEIKESSSYEKAKILARLRQNIEICKKNKLKTEFISKNNINSMEKNNLKSLSLVLGMPTWMTKEI